MGKGDKIKESKPVFLLFSQVPTFSIFLTFHVLISYTNTPIQKSIQSTTFSLALSVTVSGAQFISSSLSQWRPYSSSFSLSLSLSLSLSFSSLTRPHEAEERRLATWWQTVSAGIGPYRPFQRPFLPKLARIGTNWRKSENPKKKKTHTARTHGQQHCAPHTTSVHVRCGCSGPGAAPMLSRI